MRPREAGWQHICRPALDVLVMLCRTRRPSGAILANRSPESRPSSPSLYEIKHDGYRSIARKRDNRVRLFREPTCSPATSYRRPERVLVSGRCPSPSTGAQVPFQAGRWDRVKPMIDEHFNADRALAVLKEIYLRKGTVAAVEAAKDMISAGAAWIAQESGADEARQILQAAAGSAQS